MTIQHHNCFYVFEFLFHDETYRMSINLFYLSNNIHILLYYSGGNVKMFIFFFFFKVENNRVLDY